VSLTANRAALAAALAAALGEAYPVALDPRNVNPPCALVGPATGLEPAACGLAGVCAVYLIVPGPGNADALAVAETMLELVYPVLELRAPILFDAYVTDTTGDTGLPCYVLEAAVTT